MEEKMSANNHQKLGDLGYTESFSTPWAESASSDPDPPVSKRHYGKFRGTVVMNTDPYQQGRLMVSVPGIVITNWATPCVPLTDLAMGVFMRPRIGANVWVEFERGDPDKPIWVGCWWGKGETPLLAKAANAVPPTNAVLTMETASAGLSVTDIPVAGAPVPGNVVIRAGGVATTISMNPAGVTITAPTVTVNSPVVTINASTSCTVTSASFKVVTTSFLVTTPKGTLQA